MSTPNESNTPPFLPAIIQAPGNEDEFIAAVEQYAAIFLPLSDMADIIGISDEELREMVNTPGHPVAAAYRRGKASSKIRLRAREMELASLGSPTGIEAARESLREMEDDE